MPQKSLRISIFPFGFPLATLLLVNVLAPTASLGETVAVRIPPGDVTSASLG